MKLKYLLITLLILVFGFIYISINPSEVDFLPKCPLYATTGIYCPGCGSQRAVHNLLNFSLIEAIRYNSLLILSMIILGYHFSIIIINKVFKKHIYNYIYHPKTPIIILVIVIIFWILRNIPVYPFSLLAPQ